MPLAGEVTGIGFRTADKIALALGCSRSDRRRIEAGLVYALNMAGFCRAYLRAGRTFGTGNG